MKLRWSNTSRLLQRVAFLVFLKQKIYILIHIQLCGWVSEKNFHQADFQKQYYFIFGLTTAVLKRSDNLSFHHCYAWSIEDNETKGAVEMGTSHSKSNADTCACTWVKICKMFFCCISVLMWYLSFLLENLTKLIFFFIPASKSLLKIHLDL